jgi:aminoglycoside phosphotransferase (APT) family kinase protein
LTLTVRPWRQGLDFWADLTQAGDQVCVLRSPRCESLETSYEGLVDFGDVIEREVTALGLMSAAGLPVPRVLGWQRGESGAPSWVLLTYVAHDDDPDVPLQQLGELTRRLHDIRPRLPGLEPAGDWAAFMCDRLFHRLAAARAYCDLPADQDLRPGTAELLRSRHGSASSLLHMDLRPPNLCVRDGRIAAIIDVANCLVGDPLLELGRIRGYGLLGDQFLGGYGLDARTLGPAELTLLDIYELDTTALLTVVAVEEIDDPRMHAEQAARTRYLASRIAARVAASAR